MSLISRPFRNELFIHDPDKFVDLWNSVIEAVDKANHTLHHEKLLEVLYTAEMSFACSYDLYKNSARKTPGTFFEILIGSFISALSGIRCGKQIKLPAGEKVPTDIYIEMRNDQPSIVIPTKITTRDRVIQPWVHQLILDKVYGTGSYKTLLVCVSETQRNKDVGVNEICVPSQINMYQQYLAKLEGIFYMDPPIGYLNASFNQPPDVHLPIRTISQLLGEDLALLIG